MKLNKKAAFAVSTVVAITLADGETCVDGRCVAGPGTAGRLGESCASNEDCVSGLCGADEFYARYFAANRPVVFEDGCRFRAVGVWSPEWLASKFGDAEILVSTGRDADPHHYEDPTTGASTMILCPSGKPVTASTICETDI